MILDERLQTFLNAMDTPLAPYLEELYERAVTAHVPVIRRDVQRFLKTFLPALRPQTVLEVGTAIGFSALMMAEYAPQSCRITTIEKDADRIREAEKNIAAAGRQEQILLLAGDAAEILKRQTHSFDLIFMDAAKGQYPHFLPEILRLMHSGSVLLSDNVLQEGDLLESRYLIERRDRTIHKRMREYLYALTHTAGLSTTILPLGDGLTVSVKL